MHGSTRMINKLTRSAHSLSEPLQAGCRARLPRAPDTDSDAGCAVAERGVRYAQRDRIRQRTRRALRTAVVEPVLARPGVVGYPYATCMSQVAVPEKTLEHWVSQYLIYRYRSRCSLWWPAVGEDVDVRLLPSRPGKAVQLELKTTTASGRNQDVMIDLGQLWDYCRRPLGHQPFYVFPRPDWTGTLAADAASEGVVVTELAYSRSGRAWWFASWLVVMTAAEVADVLRTELQAHSSPKRGVARERLVRFSVSPSRKITTSWRRSTQAGIQPATINWLDFWTRLELCGLPDWPQLIRLPMQVMAQREQDFDSLTHKQVRMFLYQFANDPIRSQDEPTGALVTLRPDTEGQYRLDSADPYEFPDVDGTEDRRQVVFLDANALRRV